MPKANFIVASLIWAKDKKKYLQPGEPYAPPGDLKGEELEEHMQALQTAGAIVPGSEYVPPEEDEEQAAQADDQPESEEDEVNDD